MKRIVIKELTLLNFKGIRNLTVSFDEFDTSIFGDNGTGKTTVFDAFTWLLFGKDSKDRKDFNIKTLDRDNKAIERIPHEVSAVLYVNDEEVILKKCYNEVWSKKRGSSVETFTGHSVECYYNEVPCSVTEYGKKISEICTEQVFKLITNPLYFTSQKKDFQRSMLFNLAGDVTAEDMVMEYPQFADLIARLSGKTLEEYKREVQSKKRKIKDSIEGIPARIDERKRDMPEELDWAKLEAEIEESEKHIADIDAQIADRSKSYNDAAKQKQEIAKQLAEVKGEISKRQYELDYNARDNYRKAKTDYDAGMNRIAKLRNDYKYKKLTLQRLEKELEELNQKREGLISEWKAIKYDSLVFNDEEFVCPTCKRPLEYQDIEEKKAEMQREWNEKQAKSLEKNKAIGLEVKAQIEAKTEEISRLKDEMFSIEEEGAQLQAKYNEDNAPIAPDTSPIINTDRKIIELRNKRDDLQNQLDNEVAAPDVSDLNERKRAERDIISDNKIWLADRERIASNNKRIAELESEYQESQAQLAELEGIEYNIQQFSKARIEQVESRINGLFEIVSWKMFEQQINGGEIETCECMVNGVPFSDLNDAKKINAGLDIITAISNANGISAPIFIDNRESVTEIISVGAQVVNLIVDAGCKTLKIE